MLDLTVTPVAIERGSTVRFYLDRTTQQVKQLADGETFTVVVLSRDLWDKAWEGRAERLRVVSLTSPRTEQPFRAWELLEYEVLNVKEVRHFEELLAEEMA